MIRILQVYDHDGTNSGITSVMMNWYKNINLSEIQFDFLFCWRKKPSVKDDIISRNGKIYYIENAEKIKDYLAFIKKTKIFFEKRASDYEIIHLHSAIFCYPILYYAKKYGISHRIVHAHSISTGNTKISSIRNNILLVPMKKIATDFWACSDNVAKEWFEKRGIYSYKVVLNGIDMDLYKNNSAIRKTIRKKFCITNEEIAVCHISNMSALKNVPFVIDVFENMLKTKKECRLFLIGRDALPKEVERKIKHYGIADKVSNIGIRSDINQILQGMDICLMPSVSEGYGLVPIECQAASVPVIMSLGFPDIVNVTELSAKKKLDISEWTKCSFELLNKSHRISYENVFYKKYNNIEIVRQVTELYKNLIGQNEYV